MGLAERRTARSVSWLDLGRERRLCLGRSAAISQALARDDTLANARRVGRVLHGRPETKMERDVQDCCERYVEQDDSRAVDFKHVICTCVEFLGSAPPGHGNLSRAANDRHAHRVHARRGQTIWRRIPLLSRAEFWRYRDDLYETTELRGPRQLLSFALWCDDGTFAVLVPQE